MRLQVIQTKKWDQDEPPTELMLARQLRDEGMEPMRWSSATRAVYHAHSHDYHKVIYVVSGTIIFGFHIIGEPTVLTAGDRLSLPAGIEHNAVVGDGGVVCLEGHLEE